MRHANLRTYVLEDRIIRGSWTRTDAEGRHLACLLAALSPEVAKAEDAGACPVELMPPWLAHLTPWIDDLPDDEQWLGLVYRYADLAERWNLLSQATWQRLDSQCRLIALREAIQHTEHVHTVGACRAVVGLLTRAIAGEAPRQAEWEEAVEYAQEAYRTSSWESDRIEGALVRECSQAASWAAKRDPQGTGYAARAANAAALLREGRGATDMFHEMLDAIDAAIVDPPSP